MVMMIIYLYGFGFVVGLMEKHAFIEFFVVDFYMKIYEIKKISNIGNNADRIFLI